MLNSTKRKPSGFIIYRGPSLLDGKEIVAVATVSSRNIKTGAMVQTWIIRADIDPLTANRTGEDFSICGTCPLKGIAAPDKTSGTALDRACYVQIGQAPLGVYRGLGRGIYPVCADLAALGEGQAVRLGSYGDPAAVPAYVWEQLTSKARTWTGYSHQKATSGAKPDFSRLMVSADNLEQAEQAWSERLRTFRVVASPLDVVRGKEIICPATSEGGNKTNCSKCGLCSGASKLGKSIAVIAHGAGAKHALRLAA